MCNLREELKIKTFTGYKVAIKRGKRYYSPATGIEYVAGKKVKDPLKLKMSTILKNHDTDFIEVNQIILRYGSAYKSNMVGRTAVFTCLDGAIYKLENLVSLFNKAVILEMTISGELMRGNYAADDVVAGKFIESIEEVQYENS